MIELERPSDSGCYRNVTWLFITRRGLVDMSLLAESVIPPVLGVNARATIGKSHREGVHSLLHWVRQLLRSVLASYMCWDRLGQDG